MRVHGFYPVEVVQPKIEGGMDAIIALTMFALEVATVKLMSRSLIKIKWRCEYCTLEVVEPLWTIFTRPRKTARCPAGRKLGFLEAVRAWWKNPFLFPEYNCLSLLEKKHGYYRMISELLMGNKCRAT